jgi:hypothetical protein
MKLTAGRSYLSSSRLFDELFLNAALIPTVYTRLRHFGSGAEEHSGSHCGRQITNAERR